MFYIRLHIDLGELLTIFLHSNSYFSFRIKTTNWYLILKQKKTTVGLLTILNLLFNLLVVFFKY